MDAADLVAAEPELVALYASNLPAIDWGTLDYEQRLYALRRAYVWPGWLGALRRRVVDLGLVCGVLVGWWTA